ncbi:MAG: esterase [Burkholderiales bacterium]|nr:esterase [Burkholderiales bacterium]MDE2452815.1 esterase [Burkholderiales bacterium]
MQLAIESLPATGAPEQLMLLLHGVGGSGASMAVLAQALRQEFPQAAFLAPDAPNRFDGGGNGRQWFSVAGIGEDNRVARVAAAVAPFRSWVHQTQQRLGLGPAATAFVGFSQGAILALETTLAEDGIAGRVIAFSGRYAKPPQRAPRETTIHLLHGGADPIITVDHARAAFSALNALQGDATIDIAEGVGHEPHPVLVERAVFRLKNHIPARTWAAALGSAPLHSGPEDEDD